MLGFAGGDDGDDIVKSGWKISISIVHTHTLTGGRAGFHPHNLPSHSLSSNQPHHHAPRVINHTPLRDQRGWKGEQEKARNYGGYRGRQIEVHVYTL